MTLNANNPAIGDDDLNTTAPQSEPEAWKMPDPVFRRTSGKLPEGYARDVQAFSAPDNSVPPAEPAPTLSESDIQPKSPGMKLMLVLLGLGAMVAFLVVFLTVVYFFFFRTE